MSINILLINPNRYHHPPVVPLGLEYIAAQLADAGYPADILDLCFVENYKRHIDEMFDRKKYQIAGISIRNIDTALYPNSECFLPEIKDMVAHLRKRDVKIVLGGSGFSIAPQEILKYMGADYGVIGPGEKAMVRLVEDIHSFDANYQFVNGWQDEADHLVPERGTCFDYPRYLKAGGLAGLETQRGCNNNCPYCVEAGRQVVYKDMDCLMEELRLLVKQHIYQFHLCDAEFNQNIRHSLAFCENILANNFKLQWALYMKPRPINEELISLLKRSGAYLITLSVDAFQVESEPSYRELENFITWCKKYDLPLAVDLLLGLPNEKKETSQKLIDFFKRVRPTSVGVNTYTRIYKFTKVSAQIQENEELRKNCIGQLTNNPDFLFPVFYRHINEHELQQWLGSDALFRVEGRGDRAANYQRIKSVTGK